MRVSSFMNSVSALSVTAVWTDAEARKGPGSLSYWKLENAPYVYCFSSRRFWFNRDVNEPPSAVFMTVSA